MAAKLLQITSTCSAKCGHCPYGGAVDVIDRSSIEKDLCSVNSDHSFILVSGGEPLESPHFSWVVERLASQDLPFRIATGGFKPLGPYVHAFRGNTKFAGFNLGTDVFLRPNVHGARERMSIWRSNALVLKARRIPFGVTITLAADEDLQTVAAYLNNLKIESAYILINRLDGVATDFSEPHTIRSRLGSLFPSACIEYGYGY